MRGKATYEYAIVRLVPSVERGEFINIGVLVFSKPRRFLDLKYLLDPDRIAALAPSVDVELLEAYLQSWKRMCHGGKGSGPIGQLELPVRFRWLASSRSSILQTSAIHPGLTEDPAHVLEVLFEKYVAV